MSQRPLLVTSLALTAVALLGAGALFGRSTAQAPEARGALPPAQPAPDPGLPTEPAMAPAPDPLPEEPIGASAAAAAALAAVPGARLLGTPELVSFRGKPAYEAGLDRGTVYVDAYTRRILHDGTRPPANAGRGDDDGQLARADRRRRHHDEHEEDGDEDD